MYPQECKNDRYYPPAFCVFFSGWGTGPRRPAFDLMNQVKQEGTSLRPTYRAQNNKASLVMAVRRLSKDWKLNNTAYHNSTPTTATQQHLSGSWQYKATPFKVFDKDDKGQWQVFGLRRTSILQWVYRSVRHKFWSQCLFLSAVLLLGHQCINVRPQSIHSRLRNKALSLNFARWQCESLLPAESPVTTIQSNPPTNEQYLLDKKQTNCFLMDKDPGSVLKDFQCIHAWKCASLRASTQLTSTFLSKLLL